MNDRFRVPGTLPAQLKRHGVAPSVVLQRAGLPAGFFQQVKISVTTAELFALWRAVGDSSKEPGIGLRLGSEQRLEHSNPAAIAAVCSQSFRDAVQRVSRYKQLTCPEEIRLTAARDEVAVEFVFTEADQDEPEILIDLCLSWILTIGRRGTDGQLVPLRVELMRPSQHADLLERSYGCRVRFKAKRNALVFSRQDIDRPFVTHNEELLAIIGAQLDAELQAATADTDVCELVKRTLKRSLAGKRPSLQVIAQDLGLSERTLQRRLTEVGCSFQKVAEEARRELARHYLTRSTIEFPEVAYLLGYEDANSFFRAFQQWEGTSPGEWRARHDGRVLKEA